MNFNNGVITTETDGGKFIGTILDRDTRECYCRTERSYGSADEAKLRVSNIWRAWLSDRGYAPVMS